MKRHLDVKTEPRRTATKQTVKNVVPVSHGTSMDRQPRSLVSTFDDMERWMEESMHRPFFFDFGLRPFSRLFHDLSTMGEVSPAVDIFEEGNDVVVKAELAGMKREDISVKLEENYLIISGEKNAEEKVERKDYYRLERSYGSFSRKVHLPEGISSDKATASFKDGILEVRVPRSAGSSKRIAIE